MASIINASSSGSGGIVQTADASGVLQLQSNGTVAMSFSGTTTSAFGSINAGMESADNSIVSIGRSDNTSAYRNHVLFYRGNKTGAGIGFGSYGGGSNDAVTIVWQNTSTGEQGYLNGNGIGLGSGNSPSSGIGIRFPATQSASSDANTLDDYEEGTWTPVIKFGSTTATLTSSSASYTKVGRVVTLMVEAYVTNLNGGTGIFSLSNFPFNTYSYNRQTVAQFYFQFMSSSFPAGDKFAFISPNDSVLGVNYFTGSSGTAGSLDNTHFTTSSYVYANIIYFAP